jgi:hypothetical protein
MLLRSARAMLFLSLLFPSAGAVFALSSDVRLIQLVPPDSRIIAGMLSRSRKDHLDSFLLITRGNKIDLQDFFAIVGADATRAVHELVFVAENGDSGVLNEHSLLARGHFNRDAIFRMAAGGKASSGSYRGVPVLVVPPFEREAGKLDQLRWLAVTGEEMAIFGTVKSVQRELERWVAEAPADPMVMARLERLGSEDESWCLLPADSSARYAEGALARLDPKFGALAQEDGPLEYGIHFGSRIEVTVSSGSPAQTGLGESATDRKMSSDFLSRADATDNRKRVVVNVPRSRYEQWVARYSSGLAIDERPVH